MKTNPNVKRVLFYGDSLVFGKASGSNERLDSKTRFTGVVQDLLGESWEVLEEGLRARTLYGENGFFPERNGLEQFGPIIGSHLGIDVLVLFLGTNNANSMADVTQDDVTTAYEQYGEKLRFWCEFLSVSIPKILVVIPPQISREDYDQGAQKVFGEDGPNKMQMVDDYITQATESLKFQTLRAADFCKPATGDGIHLDAAGNTQLAAAIKGALEILIT